MNEVFMVLFFLAAIAFVFINPRVLFGMASILLLWAVLCLQMDWSAVWIGYGAAIVYGVVKADTV